MLSSYSEGMEFVAYLWKDVSYQWYEKWEQLKRYDAKKAMWDEFSYPFLDIFFSQKLSEMKDQEFVNLKQGKVERKVVCPKILSIV